MNWRHKICTVIFFIPTFLFSQTFVLQNSYAAFTNAVSMDVSPAGYFFIADAGSNEIFKMDSTGNILKTIGGYGWEQSMFDYTADIFSTTLKVYVADKNNNRIQIFDKDLNFVSEFKTNNDSQFSFAYPISIATSNMGDLFILDADNSRILKYNFNGDFLLQIGGFDAGEFSLSNPKKLSIDGNANLYVLDDNKIFVFDQFGNGLKIIPAEIEAAGISFSNNSLIIHSENNVKLISTAPGISKSVMVDLSNDLKTNLISDVKIFRNKLYVLTPKSFFVFSIK